MGKRPDVHAALGAERRSLPRAKLDDGIFDRAIHVQELLARRGQHRLPLLGLLIAAAAEHAGLSVPHYDADFESIARVTDQPQEWVVARGTI